MAGVDDQGLVPEQGKQEGPQIYRGIRRVDAPVDEVTEFKIRFAELGAFPVDDTGEDPVFHNDVFWMKVVMQQHWRARNQGKPKPRYPVLKSVKIRLSRRKVIYPSAFDAVLDLLFHRDDTSADSLSFL